LLRKRRKNLEVYFFLPHPVELTQGVGTLCRHSISGNDYSATIRNWRLASINHGKTVRRVSGYGAGSLFLAPNGNSLVFSRDADSGERLGLCTLFGLTVKEVLSIIFFVFPSFLLQRKLSLRGQMTESFSAEWSS